MKIIHKNWKSLLMSILNNIYNKMSILSMDCTWVPNEKYQYQKQLTMKLLIFIYLKLIFNT